MPVYDMRPDLETLEGIKKELEGGIAVDLLDLPGEFTRVFQLANVLASICVNLRRELAEREDLPDPVPDPCATMKLIDGLFAQTDMAVADPESVAMLAHEWAVASGYRAPAAVDRRVADK